MRVRMATDQVTSLGQLADARGVEESGRADPRGHDKKRAAPAVAFEFSRDPQRTGAAVVKRQQCTRAEIGGTKPLPSGGERLEMCLESLRSEFVDPRHGTREAKRVTVRFVGDIVIDESEGSISHFRSSYQAHPRLC